MSKVVLSQLLPINAVDALLADEAEDLGGGLIHVESDVLGACEDGAPDLLPVDEGVALYLREPSAGSRVLPPE